MTPIWFGSAINSFGVQELMQGIADFGPEPQPQRAEPRHIAPEETKVAGFVFKVQANMDPKAPRSRGLFTARLRPFQTWHEVDPCAQQKTNVYY